MNSDALDLALRHVSETKQLLESLITSSESFDYPKAKLALTALQKKTRELARVKSALAAQKHPLPSNVLVLPLARN
jgi:hypothetical protein